MSREQKLAVYEALVAPVADLELKGAKTDYTSMNGNMFSFLSAEGELAFRLPSEERAAFLERFPDAIVVQYGSVMKDYVEVPDVLLLDEAELRRLFERVVENARGLKAKPTKKPKKKQA